MANVIPLFYGTAKQQKDRQKMIEATLALEIANSKKLERANRDYFVNGELPVNNIQDLTTNEILQDKNKLMKVLANDVKSLLDREQFDLFINDATWNNIRYLRTVVQLFPRIKEYITKNARLLTAQMLLEFINVNVVEQENAEEEANEENNNEEMNNNLGNQANNNLPRAVPIIPMDENRYDNLDGENNNDDYGSSSSSSSNKKVSSSEAKDIVESFSPVKDTSPTKKDRDFLSFKLNQLEDIIDIDVLVKIYTKVLIADGNFKNVSLGKQPKALAEKTINDQYNRELRVLQNDPNYTELDALQIYRFKTEIARRLIADTLEPLYNQGGYSFPENQKQTKKNYFGFGLKGKAKKGTKMGRGMAVQEMKGVSAPVRPDRSDLYYSFGVFAVHKKSLNDNILNLKYKSFSQVHKYPKRQISEDLKDIILDAIETKKINNKLFNALTDSDKSFLTELIVEARLKETFPNIFKSGNGIAVNENPFDRFEILKGQLIAGNSSNEIKRELRLLVQKFMKDGLIEKKDGFGILELL